MKKERDRELTHMSKSLLLDDNDNRLHSLNIIQTNISSSNLAPNSQALLTHTLSLSVCVYVCVFIPETLNDDPRGIYRGHCIIHTYMKYRYTCIGKQERHHGLCVYSMQWSTSKLRWLRERERDPTLINTHTHAKS